MTDKTEKFQFGTIKGMLQPGWMDKTTIVFPAEFDKIPKVFLTFQTPASIYTANELVSTTLLSVDNKGAMVQINRASGYPSASFPGIEFELNWFAISDE